MTTEKALLAAILATPKDDLPRLVYADWLEESGESERAEFIRIQVAIWNHPARLLNSDATYGEYADLCRRERELRKANAGKWLLPSPTTYPVVISGGEQYGWGLRPVTGLGHEYIPVEFRRGFVSQVRCRLAEWVGGECWGVCGNCGGSGREYGFHAVCDFCRGRPIAAGIGPQVVAAHPVERVVLTDREPQFDRPNDVRGWQFMGGDALVTHPEPYQLPLDLLEFFPGESSPHIRHYSAVRWYRDDKANEYLSEALLAWAKAQPTATPPVVQ